MSNNPTPTGASELTKTEAQTAYDLRYSIDAMTTYLEDAPAEVVRDWKRVADAARMKPINRRTPAVAPAVPVEVCQNCGMPMPIGCGGQFYDEQSCHYKPAVPAPTTNSPQIDSSLVVAVPAPSGDICPNCVSPWKCNGPHIGEAPSSGYEQGSEASEPVAWMGRGTISFGPVFALPHEPRSELCAPWQPVYLHPPTAIDKGALVGLVEKWYRGDISTLATGPMLHRCADELRAVIDKMWPGAK